MKHDLKQAVTRAVGAVGSQRELANRIGVTQQAIAKWRKVPAERVVEVERVTGIPRRDLRPDLFGDEDA